MNVGGEPQAAKVQDGYLYLKRKWNEGDVVELNFPMEVRRLYGTLRVRDTAGQTALARGPVVYCFEGVDNGALLQALILPRDSEITAAQGSGELLKDCVVLKMKGLRESDSDALYQSTPPKREKAELTAIPYCLWGNRGLNQMRVWIRES